MSEPDLEQLLVVSRALAVMEGRLALAEASDELASAALSTGDFAAVRRVSDLARQMFGANPPAALVVATLNAVVARRSPDDDLRALAEFDLATALAEEDRPAEALALLDGLTGRQVPGIPPAAVAGNRALMFAQLGQNDEAIAGLQEVIRLSELEGSPPGRWLLNLGSVLERAGRASEARVQYERAMDGLPSGPLLLAATLSATRMAHDEGDHERAVELAHPAANLSHELHDAVSACEAMTVAARSLISLGEPDRAVVALTMALTIHVETGAAADPEALIETLTSLLPPQDAIAQLGEFAESAARFGAWERQAAFLAEQATVMALAGDTDTAISTFQRAAEIFEREQVGEGARQCLNRAAHLLTNRGDFDGAEAALRRGIAMADHSARIEQLMLIRHVHQSAGRLADADATLADALREAEQAGDLDWQVEVLINIAQLQLDQQRIRQAVTPLRRAAALARESGDSTRALQIETQLGATMLWCGDLVGSVQMLERAAEGLAAAGARADEAAARCRLAAALSGLANPDHAIEQSEIALRIGRDLGDSLIIAEALAARSETHEMQGRAIDALDGFATAAGIALEARRPDLAARYLEGKANGQRELGQHDEALRTYDEALACCHQTGDIDREASVQTNLGRLHLAAGRVDEAVAQLTQGLTTAIQLGNDWLRTIALSALADAHWQAGRHDQARATLAEARDLAEQRGYPELLWRQSMLDTRMQETPESHSEALDTLLRLADMPGAGHRDDMLRELARLFKEHEDKGPDDPLIQRIVRRLSAELLNSDADEGPAPGQPPTGWVADARRFVATGQRVFLRRAAAECDNEQARAVLEQFDERDGAVSRDLWEPVVLGLERGGDHASALALNLVIAFPALYGDIPDDQLVAALDAARASGFDECRAALALALGNRAVAKDSVNDALVHLVTAATIFNRLVRAEPDVYRRDCVDALNRLAVLYGSTGDAEPARTVFGRAISLAQGHEPAQLLRVYNNLAVLQIEDRDEDNAMETLRTALAGYEALPDADKPECQSIRVTLLQGMASIHIHRRQLAAAQGLLEEALEHVRVLARHQEELPETDLMYLLNLLGSVMGAQGRQAAALPMFEDALQFARNPSSGHTDTQATIVTLMNLAGATAELGQVDRARALSQEAIELQRPLADAVPERHGLRLVELLTNLGTILLNADHLAPARESLSEAVDRGRALIRRWPDKSRSVVVSAMDRLASALARMGADALPVANEAVQLAEQAQTRDDMWLWKGHAVTAYQLLLAQAVQAGDMNAAHAHLAALREPLVTTQRELAQDSLTAAMTALARPWPGPAPRIVVAERLSGVDMLGVLDSDGLRVQLTADVGQPARELFDAVLSVFDDEPVDSNTLAHAADAVARTLPDAVREVLDDPATTVLISGDPYWTTFPWEALRTGTGEWLGLVQPLPRAPGLTPSAINALRGAGQHVNRTAAVICPWDAVAEQPLEWACVEAEQVATRLADHGYTTFSLLGPQADADGLVHALDQRPTIIHYAGHADVISGEEMLVLASADGIGTPFSGTDLRRGAASEPLFPQAPIVVLNACHAARARAFGGRREDLVSTLLAEGAVAVVASAFPIDEVIGAAVGTLLYDGPDGEDVGSAVTRIRRALIRRGDASTLWALLTCSGNPFAALISHDERR